MFNIGTVSRMTNILEATLRVWERRYGFPRATRTEGGHRLYSQEEIFRLQRVKTRMDEGMQVSSAIRALRSAEQDGAFVSTTAATNLPVRQPLAGTSLEHLQSRLLEALFAHHLDEVSLVLEDAQRRYPLEAIIEVMIGPT